MPFAPGDIQTGNGTLPARPFGMILCGSRRSGKTNLVMYMLKREGLLRGQFEEIYLMSKSCHQPMVQQVQWTGTKDTFDEGWIQKMIDSQDKDMKRTGMAKEILIILDDCVACEGFHKSKVILDLAATGRHFRISWIILTQTLRGVGKATRDNTDGMCCWAMDNQVNMYTMYVEFSMKGSWHTFRKVFLMATDEDHSFLYVNKTNRKQPFHKNFDPITITARAGREQEAMDEGEVVDKGSITGIKRKADEVIDSTDSDSD